MIRFALALLLMSLPAFAQANGVALVIGNSAYAQVPALDNPVNDARAVSAALTRQGFDVIEKLDLDRTQMRNALREFRSRADSADVALVYYAGHGIEIGGVNYMIPVDARLEDERDAGLEMVEMDLILRQISGAKTLKMVVLDACRNNPFVTKMQRKNAGRGVSSGLGRVTYAESDTLIAYAAAAGEITPDGVSGGNSPFTRAFVNALSGPPADVRRLLGRARDEMRRSLPGAAPFVYTSLGGDELVINPLSPSAPAVSEHVPAQTPAEGSISADFVRIDRDGTLADWDAFLIRWETKSDHPLYAFALEKREALKAAGPARGNPRTEGNGPTETTAALAPPSLKLVSPTPETDPDNPRSADAAARDLQQVMRARSCYRGAIDGILGRGSRRGLAVFSEQIGRELSLPAKGDVAGLDALIDVFAANPDVVCPVPKAPVRQPAAPAPAKTTETPRQASPEPAQTTSGGSATTAIQGSNATTRKRSSKTKPLSPFDCLGSNKTLYDCD